MSYEYTKKKQVRLREVGKDEKWLQDLIAKDPSILELGDVELYRKESAQPSGGRIDMILRDASSDTPIHYEVEVMLGSVDESHIIRTIEYWDVEKRRFPSFEHRAVIVAEDITNRFFNVIGLLNRSVPIIALKLQAMLVGDSLTVSFIKVMDVVREELPDNDESEVLVDRNYWVKKGRTKSLEIIDAYLALISNRPNLRVKYNRGHVAIGTTATNFLWMLPRKRDYILVQADAPNDRAELVAELERQGVEAAEHPNGVTLTINPTLSDIRKHPGLFVQIFERAEAHSHT
jgi:hypothetical protein